MKERKTRRDGHPYLLTYCLDKRKQLLTVGLTVVIAVLSIAAIVEAKARFGTYCRQDYQEHNGDPWQDNLDYVWDRCAGFNNELDDTDTKVFYFNMHGAKPYFETDNDEDWIETVNLLWTNTHGSTTSTNARWVMWDYGQRALSSNMYLGNESYGLSIMANHCCKQLQNDDGHIFDRWSPVFRGGLRYVTGSHGTLVDAWETDEVGEDFADELQGSAKIRYAWRDGVSDWWYEQDLAVMSMGNGKSDCEDRRNNMKWQNYTSYNRRYDDDVNYWCRTRWTDYTY